MRLTTISKAAATIVAVYAMAGAAVAQDTFRWTMATSWPSGLPAQDLANLFADRVESMSGGRLVIDVHPAGAIVSAFEVLDAVDQGSVEMGHSFSNYWIGKNHAAPMFAQIPMAFEGDQFLSWIYEAGGLELWNRLYQEEMGLNVKVMPIGLGMPENLAWSDRPLRNVSDFEGLKYRASGWWGEILREMDVPVTTIPAGEIYTALERGVLDAVEFSDAWNDRFLGFHEVVDYVNGPALQAPSGVWELIINKNAYDELPVDLKAIVDTAAEAITLRSWTAGYHNSVEAFEFFQSQEGLEFVKASDEAQHAFRERAWEYLDRQSEQDPFFSELWTSVKEYYLRLSEYDDFYTPVRPAAR